MQNPNPPAPRLSPLRAGVLAVATGVAVASALVAPEVDALRQARDAHSYALGELESQFQALHDHQDALAAEIDGQQDRLSGSDQALGRLRAQLAATYSIQGDLNEGLSGLRNEFQAQSAALARTTALAQESREVEPPAPPSADDLQAERSRQRAELRHNILDPIFQLAGDDAVGSAVMVWEDEDEGGVYQLALTSYHVVRDILGEEESGGTVDGYVELPGGEEVRVDCRLLAKDVPTDLALLRVEGGGRLDRVAAIAPLSRLRQIEVFAPVYTSGCPLGTAAQATRGEITRTQWQVGGENLWMISSPAYFGNSGGGVFLEQSQELIGIFAKIYTHGSYRPQVVTHMGLAVPLPVLHEWLESESYGHLLPEEDAGLALATASSQGPLGDE